MMLSPAAAAASRPLLAAAAAAGRPIGTRHPAEAWAKGRRWKKVRLSDHRSPPVSEAEVGPQGAAGTGESTSLTPAAGSAPGSKGEAAEGRSWAEEEAQEVLEASRFLLAGQKLPAPPPPSAALPPEEE